MNVFPLESFAINRCVHHVWASDKTVASTDPSGWNSVKHWTTSLKSAIFIARALSVRGLYFLFTISGKTIHPVTPKLSTQHDWKANMYYRENENEWSGIVIIGSSFLRGKVVRPTEKGPPNNGAPTWPTKDLMTNDNNHANEPDHLALVFSQLSLSVIL